MDVLVEKQQGPLAREQLNYSVPEKLQDARTELEQFFLQGCVSGVDAPDLLYLSTLGRKPSMKT